MTGEPLLGVSGVTMRFGGVVALNEVDLVVEQGTIHGLIGPNGSGKSTLINIVTGLLRPTAGSVHLDGQEISGLLPHRVTARGIARTFQHPRVLGGLSTLDNVMLGGYGHYPGSFSEALFHLPFREPIRLASLRRRGKALLEEQHLAARADARGSDLSLMEQRRLELARALVSQPRLILMDEPTSGMGPAETNLVRDMILGLHERGITVLLVAHDMRLITSIAHRVSALNFGQKITEGPPAEVLKHPAVERAYLGR